MKEIHFIHTVKKEKEGTYYTVPFEVPENTVSFTVTYKYEKVSQGLLGKNKNACIIDLGIIDCDGKFIGWSGSARDSITVGEFSSTNGYFSQPIKPGKWQIIVGAYKINASQIDVHYQVEFEEKKKKFLFGDLHMHSTASDGQFTVPQLAQKAKEIGLDFIAVADHNNYCENFSLPRVPGITIIPAVEWTHYKGHMNFFGIKAPFENSFIANSKEEMKKLISDAKEKGAVI
ncbi:MAG: PHP domain-containing protein, partial [Acutalibacteraceae bacterium]